MNDDLPGLPAGYEQRMPRQSEAEALCALAGFGGRQIFLSPEAAEAWCAMSAAAESAGVPLLLLSGFRSVARQTEIIRKKLAEGQPWEMILRVNAYPGFSEHHAGRAVDIGAPGYEPLTENFEKSPQFIWLAEHAAQYGFYLSFPRHHSSGLVYEPWHWCLKK